jgi:glycosyltransferase involved in cell wall biosynthesis
MKVSVLIPTYNRGYIIRDALESVLSQTYRDLEIFVIDDGSSDRTREIVGNFKEERIHYLRHNRNRGCSAAYNTGISAARQEVVGFLDSDDLWKPDYLERQVDFLARHAEVDVVFSDTLIQEELATIPSLIGLLKAFPKLLETHPKAEEYVLSGREMYLCLLEEVPIKPSACVIRREMFEKAGVFDEAWPSGTDWDLFLRVSRQACFGYIDQPLVVQRRTHDATHQKFREQDKIFLLSLFTKEKEKLGNDREALCAVNRGIFSHYNSLAWTYLERDEGLKALSLYLRGFKETKNPILLRKTVSGLIRIAGRSVTKAHVRKANDAFSAESCLCDEELSGPRSNK